jgi:hypothetical protein
MDPAGSAGSLRELARAEDEEEKRGMWRLRARGRMSWDDTIGDRREDRHRSPGDG